MVCDFLFCLHTALQTDEQIDKTFHEVLQTAIFLMLNDNMVVIIGEF